VPYSWQTYRTLLHGLNYRLVVLLRRDADHWVYQDLIRNHMKNTLPELQECLLEEYGSDVDGAQINWHQPHEQETESPSQAAERFLRYHRAVGKITEAILRYTYRNDDYPLADGSFRNAWEQIATDAAQPPLSSYGVLVTQTLITTAYYVDRIEGGEVGSWALAIANVMENGDPRVVEQAFEELERGDYSNHKLVSIYLRYGDEQDERGILTRLFGGPAVDTPSFEDWLDPFRQNVQERYSRLQEG
ncbi:hypothetical protein, partial [Natrinema sp. H-ect4]|uniref:hypothetical protein n=1 Tax=Natrinema sp. H-ect4 TaxID=3242699 RepID=UPI0035A90DFE